MCIARWLLIPWSLAALAGCAPEVPGDSATPPDACGLGPGEEPVLEVSHYGLFDALGTTAWCGIPPQGGAPYAPFGVRLRGLDPLERDVLHTAITATDTATGAQVGATDFDDPYLCANAGESAGYWVKSEFHLRFFGYTVEELHGREVAIRFEVSAGTEALDRTYTFDLDCQVGR